MRPSIPDRAPLLALGAALLLAGCITSSSGPDGGPCTHHSCADLGKNCGTVDDGCGSQISCGGCSAGLNCGGGGPNVCGTATCTPLTCAGRGWNCGSVSDGCSTVLQCGSCGGQETCGG